MRWICFWRSYNSKQYLLNERLWFSQLSVVFCEGNPKMKFLLASMKSLTNCEIPSSNPLQRACSGFLIAACVFKVVPKPACDYENCSISRLWIYCTLNLNISTYVANNSICKGHAWFQSLRLHSRQFFVALLICLDAVKSAFDGRCWIVFRHIVLAW